MLSGKKKKKKWSSTLSEMLCFYADQTLKVWENGS